MFFNLKIYIINQTDIRYCVKIALIIYNSLNKTMKFAKQQSLSTDTRLSRSGIFNNSSLNVTHTAGDSSNNFYMSNNIHNS